MRSVVAFWCLVGPSVVLPAPLSVAQGPPATPVVVDRVVERDLPASIRLVGTVRASRRAVVAAEVAGIVRSFPAEEGDRVQAGQVLCQIDPEPARLRLAEAQGRLESMKARLAELENGTRQEVLQRLEAAVGEAQAQVDLWRFERDRVEQLLELNQSNPKEVHDARMQLLTAERRLAQAKARYEEALHGPRREQIDQARADVAAQQAVVRRLARDLDRTAIRAPFDGFVVSRSTEVGEWINVGGPVCELAAIDSVKIRANVPERAVAFARPGAPARVQIQALGRSFQARIARVIPLADETARTFPVEIDLPNPEHLLLPGMFVWAHVPSGPAGRRLMISKDAIVPSGTSKRIYVVRSGPHGAMAMPVPVETGLEADGLVEIRAQGIRPDDMVVVRANERLYGPTPVIPQPAGAEQRVSPRGPHAPAPASRPHDATGNTGQPAGDVSR